MNEEQNLVGKWCGKCNQLYSLNDFYKDKYDLFGKTSTCKYCRAVRWEQFREANPDYYRKYWLSEREKLIQSNQQWRKDNPERHIRHAVRGTLRRQQSLSDCLPPDKQYIEEIEQCKTCVITGETVGAELDHILPISKGNWGSNKGNLMYLSQSLNTSKGSKNVFDWYESMEQERLDYLVEGKLTVAEFKTKMIQILTVKAAEKGLTFEQYKQEYNEEYYREEKLNKQ